MHDYVRVDMNNVIQISVNLNITDSSSSSCYLRNDYFDGTRHNWQYICHCFVLQKSPESLLVVSVKCSYIKYHYSSVTMFQHMLLPTQQVIQHYGR
jgi:hypothetical protein